MTVDIAKTHLSLQKSVYMLGVLVAPISVDITDSSERWATDDAYTKVKCDATSFIGNVCWIARYIIILLFFWITRTCINQVESQSRTWIRKSGGVTLYYF